jgi:hypothetical protein
MSSAKQDPAGFWDDSGRYGFGSALKKRLFGFKVGEESWRWKKLLDADATTKQRLLRVALGTEQSKVACWIFEALIIETNFDLAQACAALKPVLPRNDEAAAERLTVLLPAFPEHADLTKLNLGVRMLYLFGSAYLARANALQGKDQARFEVYRAQAVQFFERARALAPQEQMAAVNQAAYRSQAQADYPYTDEKLAATYEQAMYLVWVPPVVSSSSSSVGDGG